MRVPKDGARRGGGGGVVCVGVNCWLNLGLQNCQLSRFRMESLRECKTSIQTTFSGGWDVGCGMWDVGRGVHSCWQVQKSTFPFHFPFLQGYKTGFIDADIHTQLKAKFSRNSAAPSSSSIKVTYIGRSGQETLLGVLTVSDSTVTRAWDIPEMTWSEDHRNLLNIYVSHGEITLDKVELIRGYTGPDRPVAIYSSDAILLQVVLTFRYLLHVDSICCALY